jgi:hypothetical protein
MAERGEIRPVKPPQNVYRFFLRVPVKITRARPEICASSLHLVWRLRPRLAYCLHATCPSRLLNLDPV